MKELYILDASYFLFRSYYAIGGMTNDRGESTGALFGFIRSIQKIIKDFSPTHLVIVFDGKEGKEKRRKLFKGYKAHRKGMPEDLLQQLGESMRYCDYAGLPHLVDSQAEADDLIGTIAKWMEGKGWRVFICSGDKDFFQLISKHVFVLNPHKGNLLIDESWIKKKYQFLPQQFVDYLAMVGDSSDNIPGIPGVGNKTASALLNTHGSLEGILSFLKEHEEHKYAPLFQRGKEQLWVSKQLATIAIDCPFHREEERFLFAPKQIFKLEEWYREKNFFSLLKELKESTSSLPSQKKETILKQKLFFVQEREGVRSMLKNLEGERELCFFLTTTEDSSMKVAPQSLGVGCENREEVWFICPSCSTTFAQLMEEMKPLLVQVEIFSHHCKTLLHFLEHYGIKVQLSFDTMIAACLLNSKKPFFSLEQLVLDWRIEEEVSVKEEKVRGLSSSQDKDRGILCCQRICWILTLKKKLERKLKERELERVFYQIELPLISVLTGIERVGVYFDRDQLLSMSEEISQWLHALEEKVYFLAEEKFNLRSPKQLASILFDKLAIKPMGKKRKTGVEVLEPLRDRYPIVQKVLEFRTLEKLRSTYIDSLPLQIDSQSGRIHPTFVQLGAETGRLSCQHPNLQNIPIRTEEGKRVRSTCKPMQSDWSLLSADYSQIELRLLAHFSEDARLLSAFSQRKDVHTLTASEIFSLPEDEITPLMRRKAKAVNFGVIYGQQAFGLAKILEIKVKEAAQFIEKYFQIYPGVKRFLEKCKEQAREKGFVLTMEGRRRSIPRIHHSNSMIRSAAERVAVNTPLQGSQADVIKRAMIEVYRFLEKRKHCKLILQIHDELLIELPDSSIASVKEGVVAIMENVVHLNVPLIVDITVGKNWGEC